MCVLILFLLCVCVCVTASVYDVWWGGKWRRSNCPRRTRSCGDDKVKVFLASSSGRRRRLGLVCLPAKTPAQQSRLIRGVAKKRGHPSNAHPFVRVQMKMPKF